MLTSDGGNEWTVLEKQRGKCPFFVFWSWSQGRRRSVLVDSFFDGRGINGLCSRHQDLEIATDNVQQDSAAGGAGRQEKSTQISSESGCTG